MSLKLNKNPGKPFPFIDVRPSKLASHTVVLGPTRVGKTKLNAKFLNKVLCANAAVKPEGKA